MKFNVDIKNFGMIKEATVKVSPFTVLAGSNSSGKSFITRALYSFFSTINKDYITTGSFTNIRVAGSFLNHAFQSVSNPSQNFIDLHYELTSEISIVPDLIKEVLGTRTFIEQSEKTSFIIDKISSVIGKIEDTSLSVNSYKKYKSYVSNLNEVKRILVSTKMILSSPEDYLISRIEKDFKDALKNNFQALSLENLINFNAKKSSFVFDSIGSIKIESDDIEFELNSNGIVDIQSLYNVVYLESPIYWKLRSALEDVKESRSMTSLFRRRKNNQLTGVPQYFYDLLDLLKENVKDSGKSKGIKEVEEKIDNILKGELAISENGDIHFKDVVSNKSVDLNLTATGVTSLGVISLLLKKNVISEGSFIFFDEPEVNLHPAWQKVMVEVLCSLSLAGVNIVMATHSIDMMKYIEGEMEKLSDNEISEIFSINRLSSDGVSIDTDLAPYQALSKIKEDLGRPFYEMLMESDF